MPYPACETGQGLMCNGLRTCRNANVFVFEQGYEREGQHQRVACEDEPHGLPVGNAVLSVILHHFTAHNAAQDTAEAIGQPQCLARSA